MNDESIEKLLSEVDWAVGPPPSLLPRVAERVRQTADFRRRQVRAGGAAAMILALALGTFACAAGFGHRYVAGLGTNGRSESAEALRAKFDARDARFEYWASPVAVGRRSW
ncbi:MAG: hypothetical protein ACYC35_17520 [Pirellulales bacterium]|jgi:hypothetical protein